MFCSKCGSQIKAFDKFCPNCGKSQTALISRFISKWPAPIVTALKRRHEKIFRAVVIGGPLFVTIVLIINYILPAYSLMRLAKGKEYLSKGEYGPAIAAFSAAKAAGADNAETYSLLGRAYASAKDYENALKSLEEAAVISESYDSLKLLAQILEQSKNYDSLEDTLLRIKSLYPNDPYAYIALAKLYAEQRRYENASLLLEEILTRQESREAATLLYNIYAQSYLNNKSLEKAGTLSSKAKEYFQKTDVLDLDLYLGRGITVSPSGQYLLTEISDRNSRIVNILERNSDSYSKIADFTVPAGYPVSARTITFSPSEDKIAFYNSDGEPFVRDSFIYIYDIETKILTNLSDPKEDYPLFDGGDGIFIIDSLPCFSADGKSLYFARYSSKSSGLYEADMEGGGIVCLYEPKPGGRLDYRIMERDRRVYFSLVYHDDPQGGGIFVYHDNDESVEKLKFDYDKTLYNMALWDMTSDGRYLLYTVTVASQNNSLYLKILDLDNMETLDIYAQEIDVIDSQFLCINYHDMLGQKMAYICKNAAFSRDGEKLLLAELNIVDNTKIYREIYLKTGNVYIKSQLSGGDIDSFAYGGRAPNGLFAELATGEVIIYDGGLKLMRF